jgi:hypothetical protein
MRSRVQAPPHRPSGSCSDAQARVGERGAVLRVGEQAELVALAEVLDALGPPHEELDVQHGKLVAAVVDVHPGDAQVGSS